MLQFEKFGALFQYDGIPIYAGNYLLTPRRMVWWWPINWVAVSIALPIIAVKMAVNKNKGAK